ncbi:MAG: hypothetical protein XD93_0112 [candidate division WS6 bacterium 34_10]|jgi:hypothetical protein|uniref:Uncharacterized protein n=1 Tax=candidate division WS6 bacterium 34_10 TaxID=1641389 RepID=A0A117M0P4_9BACT|nr:MAG: hypothetical protein XD93_0112 [candidate division WS6 bacterium 34_10]
MSYAGTPNNGEQLESNEGVLYYLAKKYEEGIVTDNNMSEINWSTGLEQAIAFQYELNPNIDEDLDNIFEIKHNVFNKVFNFDYQGYATEGDTDFHYSAIKLGIYEKGDEIVHQEFVDDYYGDEWYNKWIDRLAKAVIAGILTEDNASYLGLTGLDQVIILGSHLEPFKFDKDMTIVRIIKHNVKEKMKFYQRGNRLNGGNENVFDLRALWAKE